LYHNQRKGTILITSCEETTFIFDVLFIPQLDQDLLNVGQLIEKGFKVVFENIILD